MLKEPHHRDKNHKHTYIYIYSSSSSPFCFQRKKKFYKLANFLTFCVASWF